MITENILNMLTAPLFAVLDLLPSINFVSFGDWIFVKNFLIQAFRGIGCLIPLGDFFPIITSIISLHLFRLAWAILLRVKSFIPLFGG